jgi:hypothetical protein
MKHAETQGLKVTANDKHACCFGTKLGFRKLMKYKMKQTIAFFLFALFTIATPVGAAELYDCKREHYSTRGFTTAAAAESWFPQNIEYIVADDKKWSAIAHLGVDVKRSVNERKFGVSNIPNGTQNVSVREVWKPVSVASAETYLGLVLNLQSAGYSDIDPVHYRCSRPKKTDWTPVEE